MKCLFYLTLVCSLMNLIRMVPNCAFNALLYVARTFMNYDTNQVDFRGGFSLWGSRQLFHYVVIASLLHFSERVGKYS